MPRARNGKRGEASVSDVKLGRVFAGDAFKLDEFSSRENAKEPIKQDDESGREGDRASVTRVRVTYKFECHRGHVNTGERVLRVERKEEAGGRIHADNPLWGECRFCSSPSPPTRDWLQVVAVEDLPENPFYGCMGYVCSECGERVTVFRIEENTGIDPPPTIRVVCTKGHKRTITLAKDIGSLIHWEEKNISSARDSEGRTRSH